MGKEQRNGDGEQGKYIRVSGLWRNGKIFLGNNIRKRVAQKKGETLTDEELKDSCRFRVSENTNKSGGMFSNDADAHLIVESKHFDELIEYLQIVKTEHDEYWDKRNGG